MHAETQNTLNKTTNKHGHAMKRQTDGKDRRSYEMQENTQKQNRGDSFWQLMHVSLRASVKVGACAHSLFSICKKYGLSSELKVSWPFWPFVSTSILVPLISTPNSLRVFSDIITGLTGMVYNAKSE